ncbi:hypothetical protein [Halegenticoccus tardaugens]|uniref:hypothetical protein n=1 Tax=Halegenticoccus tardaugens TaxID=2071624 RepID=UPI00100BD006|nr:hypothetical protein [Halegenticoccus tardaugens]
MTRDENERRERRRSSERVADEDVLNALRAAPFPTVNTRYLAIELDLTYDATARRLRRLRDDGRVERLEIGDRLVLWWLPDEV